MTMGIQKEENYLEFETLNSSRYSNYVVLDIGFQKDQIYCIYFSSVLTSIHLMLKWLIYSQNNYFYSDNF